MFFINHFRFVENIVSPQEEDTRPFWGEKQQTFRKKREASKISHVDPQGLPYRRKRNDVNIDDKTQRKFQKMPSFTVPDIKKSPRSVSNENKNREKILEDEKKLFEENQFKQMHLNEKKSNLKLETLPEWQDSPAKIAHRRSWLRRRKYDSKECVDLRDKSSQQDVKPNSKETGSTTPIIFFDLENDHPVKNEKDERIKRGWKDYFRLPKHFFREPSYEKSTSLSYSSSASKPKKKVKGASDVLTSDESVSIAIENESKVSTENPHEYDPALSNSEDVSPKPSDGFIFKSKEASTEFFTKQSTEPYLGPSLQFYDEPDLRSGAVTEADTQTEPLARLQGERLMEYDQAFATTTNRYE